MVAKSEQQRVKALLTEAITVLCKNGLQYRRTFSVEGLLGITLDDEDVFLVNINQAIEEAGEPEEPEEVPVPEPTVNSVPVLNKPLKQEFVSSVESGPVPVSIITAGALGEVTPIRNITPLSENVSNKKSPGQRGRRRKSRESLAGSPASKRKAVEPEPREDKLDTIVIKEERLSDNEADEALMATNAELNNFAQFNQSGFESSFMSQGSTTSNSSFNDSMNFLNAGAGCSSWDPSGDMIPPAGATGDNMAMQQNQRKRGIKPKPHTKSQRQRARDYRARQKAKLGDEYLQKDRERKRAKARKVADLSPEELLEQRMKNRVKIQKWRMKKRQEEKAKEEQAIQIKLEVEATDGFVPIGSGSLNSYGILDE